VRVRVAQDYIYRTMNPDEYISQSEYNKWMNAIKLG
jgi:hypothetical protein